jgi:hypothetical protein
MVGGVKLKKFLFLLLIICILSCNGCSNDIKYDSDYNEIVADPDTHIMYYSNDKFYICPYYSNNGKLCKYEDGKIIEIE